MLNELWRNYLDALNGKNWGKALSILGTLQEKYPQNPHFNLKMGDVFRLMGRNEDAALAYKKAASLFSEKGLIDKSIAIHKLILRLSPEGWDVADMFAGLIDALRDGRQNKTPVPHLEHIAEYPEAAAPGDTIFSCLSAEENGRLSLEGSAHVFQPGQGIIEEGDTGDSIYFIRSGSALVTAHILGRLVELAVLESGDIFGEVGFLTGRPRTASVLTLTELEVLEIDRALLEGVIRKTPAILSELEDFYLKRTADTLMKARRFLEER